MQFLFCIYYNKRNKWSKKEVRLDTDNEYKTQIKKRYKDSVKYTKKARAR